MSEPTPLLVFADDWGRHPSSCQHLVAQLLPGRKVWWANTIGTRPVRFDAYTLMRGVGKIAEWFTPAVERPEDRRPTPIILRPFMWPSFAGGWQRALNKKFLRRSLLRAIGDAQPVAITTIPIVADLVGEIPVRKWIYYCVDDFSEWPGLDGATLAGLEREFLAKVDATVAVSENLQRKLTDLGASPTLLTHGVDLDHWRERGPQGWHKLDRLEPPFFVFWGLIDARLNVDWLLQLHSSLECGTIVLVGPQDYVDPRLKDLPRLALTGPADYAELPRVANRAAVLIMPYADLPVTRAMQPLKLKEYLATGLPVVAAKLPATESWSEACDVVDSAAAFVVAVHARANVPPPPEQIEAREVLQRESWRAKARQLAALWGEELP